MNGKIDFNVKKRLSDWIGRDCQFELLYKLSRDGGTSETFHELCNNKGPTVTIFYNTDNNVYGGYTSLSCTNDRGWCSDDLSFLFKLYTNKRWEPRKFPSKMNMFENVLFSSRSGPLFEDLRSFDESVEKTSGYYSLSTHGLFCGNYFDMGVENAQSVANGHNNVTDLEVYLVKDGSGEFMMVPWSDPPEWKSSAFIELKNYVIDYQPLEVPEINVLLVGQIGAGKSSLLNTMNSIFKGEISSRAWAGSSENSVTTSFNKFRIRDPSTRKFLNFRLCDTRGLEENMCMKNEDIALILDGHIPHNYTFNPIAHASTDVPGFLNQPTLKDKTHVVVFVVDGSTISVMPEGVFKKVKEIKHMLIDRGIPLLVYITKIDKVCPLVDKDVTKVFFSTSVEDVMNEVADVIAIPRAHILPVKNYEKEGCLKTDINILALKALKMTLLFADDFLENQSELQPPQAVNDIVV